MSRAEHQYICLSVSFSASDGCLVISTEEEPFTFLGEKEFDWLIGLLTAWLVGWLIG